MDSWTERLSTRERVRKIALSLTRPRSVNWIKNEADVASWDTTKDELERLVEYGQIKRVEDDSGNETRYRYGPNYRRRYLDRVEELAAEHTKDELRNEFAEIQEQIEAWQDTYGVNSLSELGESVTDADLSSDEIRERNAVIRRWKRSRETKRLVDHALSLYDDLESVTDPETDPRPGEAAQ
ncbi:HTH-domain containing transcriptional regulator [Halalkaliarchaeum sp. AArc-CO]|uniref:DUF7342 family protein n=1 Tax=unclassified Halalkaliarchaeum TaxID=2678344 RepID=UPI00217E511F|nr:MULTISPECIES: hypothetical protein [unclassified Halalkaliarchaeum]MDR5673346.1 hypothetical protein [Halalkaliarchaeum sp. AArc-GB]UWG49686.1 HTH-domain containing transcriptional regulator [Halalkaliarchaeum sp. AArc-CO]